MEYIRIHEPIVKNEIHVNYELTYSKSLRKFFHSNSFYIKYDTTIEDVSNDILVIPCLGSIVTTAWAKGANIYVDSIDADFLISLNKIKGIFNEIYQGLNFKGEIIPNKVKKNEFANKKLGMLFSGGLDSTTMYIQNRREKPNLYTMIGGVIPSENKYFTKLMKNTYMDFADKESVNLYFIESDLRTHLNELFLSAIHAPVIFSHTWWETINHGLVQLSLCAPITIKKISAMKIALSTTFSSNYGADARIVGNIQWAGINVIPEGYEYNRQEKKHYILKKFIKNNYYPQLQVCLFAPSITNNLNCGYCSKCSRDIIGLIVEGIDPRKCGFVIYEDFFEHAKERVIPTSMKENLTMIQKHIKNNQNHTKLPPNVSEFFSWFKNYDFNKKIKEPQIKSLIYKLLTHFVARSPLRIQNLVMNFLNKVRKKKHWLR